MGSPGIRRALSTIDKWKQLGVLARLRCALKRADERLKERWLFTAALSVGLASIALLGVPRSVPPEDIPQPRIRRVLLQRQWEQETALAREALLGLPFRVRVVGELLRRLGQAEAHRDAQSIAVLRQQLLDATALAAKEHGGRPMLALRALQTSLLVRAVGEYLATGEQNADIQELGGTFLERASETRDAKQRTRLTDAELAAVFRVRWSQLTGLSEATGFAPTLNDWRLFYRARLSRAASEPWTPERIASQLSDVRALSQLDAEYPADYARGILLYRLGSISAALESFRAHLRAHEDGEWNLRARNYATACAQELFAP